MSPPTSKSELIAGMAEEFVARYRAGERPPISEYAARRPELAHEIREFFEAVALIENLAPADSRTVTGPEFPTAASGESTLDRLGDYRIIREVGRGGMGVVYEAEQLSLGRHVALKVLPAQLLVDDKQRLRFEREAKAAARLHHTNIVPVFGVGHEAGTHYYVMQFIQGKGLDAVLDDLRQLRLQQTLSPPPRGPSRPAGGDDKPRTDDVTASALAKSLLAGAFPGTDHVQIDASETDEADASSAAQAANCRGGSPLTPPSGDSKAGQPSLGNEPTLLGSDATALPSERGPATAGPAGGVTGLPPRQPDGRLPPAPECRGGSPLTPPGVGSNPVQPALGDEPTLVGSDGPKLSSERDPAIASPAGGVTGLPPLQPEDRLPTAPESRGGSPLTPPSGATNAVPPALGNEPTLLGSDSPVLPSERDPAIASPAGGVKGLPPRQTASSPLLLPSDPGSSVRSRTRKSTYWESIARVGTQVASALQYAHDQGVLHRDIKPSNLLLDLRGQVWITDFGLAKADDQQDLTHTGDILGTLRYMPPEAFEAKSDRRGDIYALGLTLYEMLAFRPAYDERDRRKLIQQVTEANPDRLERIDKTIPRDLATVIHKAIEREPAHRYQKAQDLADDLQRFVNDEPIHARRISSIERFVRWRRRNRGLALLGGSFALLMFVVTIAAVAAANHFRKLNRDLAWQNYVSDMNLAGHAIESNHLVQARELLQRHMADANASGSPTLEWEWMSNLCFRANVSIPVHEAWVYRVGFHPNGHQVYTIGLDREPAFNNLFAENVRFWELESGNPLRSKGPEQVPDQLDLNCNSVFNKPMSHFARTESNLDVRVTNLMTGESILLPQACRAREDSLELSENGGRLVTYTPDKQQGRDQPNGSFQVWDISSRRRIAQVGSLSGADFPHSIDVDGRRVAIAFREPSVVKVWTLGDEVAEQTIQGLENVKFSAFSPDGRTLAVASRHAVSLWDLSTAREVSRWPTTSETCMTLSYNRDGRLLAVGGLDGVVEVFATETGEKKFEAVAHAGLIFSLSFNRQGTVLLTGGADGMLRTWNLLDRPPLVQCDLTALNGEHLSLSPNGEFLLSGVCYRPDSQTAQLWNTRTGHRHGGPLQCQHSIVSHHWTNDSKRLYLVDASARIAVVDVGTATISRHFPVISQSDPVVAVTGDGERLAVAAGNGDINLCEPQTGTVIRTINASDVTLYQLAWSCDSRLLASIDHRKILRIWDAATGVARVSTPLDFYRVTSLTLSDDGRRLAIGMSDQNLSCQIHIFDLVQNRPPTVLRGHTTNTVSGSFNDAGDRFVSWGSDSTIRVWDVDSGSQVSLFKRHDRAVTSVRFRSDGSQLLSVQEGASIRSWISTPVSAAAESSNPN